MPNTSISNENPTKNILLIPGGSGLSSKTLKIFDKLSDNFNLHYLEVQETSGTSFDITLDIDDFLIDECQNRCQ